MPNPLVNMYLGDQALWLFPLEYVLVGLGETADGFTSDIEVIDIYDDVKPCSPSNFPYAAAGASGIPMMPVICGGHNDTHHTNECYWLYEGKWEPDKPMSEKR